MQHDSSINPAVSGQVIGRTAPVQANTSIRNDIVDGIISAPIGHSGVGPFLQEENSPPLYVNRNYVVSTPHSGVGSSPTGLVSSNHAFTTTSPHGLDYDANGRGESDADDPGSMVTMREQRRLPFALQMHDLDVDAASGEARCICLVVRIPGSSGLRLPSTMLAETVVGRPML